MHQLRKTVSVVDICLLLLQDRGTSMLSEAWTHCVKAPSWLCAAVQSYYEVLGRGQRFKRRLGFSTLLTWIGPWLVDMSTELKSLPPQASLVEVCTALRSLQRVKEIWDRAYRHARSVGDRLKASYYAVCLEVCPQTFALQRKLQLHCHLFIKSHKNMYCNSLDEISCDGSVPYVCH